MENLGKKVAFYTLGCKVNQYETNGMIEKFKSNGYEIVSFNDKADIYIVNTCTVTSISDKKSRQYLRQAKRKNPDSIVVAVGCYVQTSRSELEKIPEIDLCVGTNDKPKIVQIVEDYSKTNASYREEDVFSYETYQDFGSVTYNEKTRSVIKIQDGCDRFCSYCVIPYARGRVRSRDTKSVLNEIEKVSLSGIKEVVLTGIHIASYGKDFKNGYGLIDLLEEINKIPGIERIRIGSLEPTIFTDDFLNRLVKLEKVCHQFHLSLQSGCDGTLKRMNRTYTVNDFSKIANNLRKSFCDTILTTDIIVGFSGETDEEFNLTYKFLKDIKFFKMHVFKYSPRKGTKAYSMPNTVDEKEKTRRSKCLIKMSDENEKEYLKRNICKTTKVLFEECEDGYLKGYTSNYMRVKVKGSKDLIGQIKEVNIKDLDGLELIGDII